MAKYQLTGPDGKNYEIEAPDDASQDEVLQHFRDNVGKVDKSVDLSGLDKAKDPAAYKAGIEAEAQRRQSEGGLDAIGATQATVGDMAAVGALPQMVAAGRVGLKKLAHPDSTDFSGEYGRERDVVRAQIEAKRKELGWGALPLDLLGGAAMAPARGAAAAAEAIPEAASYGRQLLDQGFVGAGFGGAYGFNQDTGDWGSKVKSGIENAAGGFVAAPAVKIGLDTAGVPAGWVRDVYRGIKGRMADRANAVARDAADAGLPSPPTFMQGGAVTRGIAAGLQDSIVGGPIRDEAGNFIQPLARRIGETISPGGEVPNATAAGEQAQGFLREQLLDRSLKDRGIDTENLTPQERQDISGISPGPGTRPNPPTVARIQPDRLTDDLHNQWVDAKEQYKAQTARALGVDNFLREGAKGFGIRNVSYSPEQQSYVVTKTDNSTYNLDWQGVPLGVTPEAGEATYVGQLIQWLNGQQARQQALSALKGTADTYAAKLAEAVRKVYPTEPIEPPAAQGPQYRPIDRNLVGPDAQVAQTAEIAQHQRNILDAKVRHQYQPDLQLAQRKIAAEPFFSEPSFVRTWQPVLDHFVPPEHDPLALRGPANPLSEEPPENFENFVRWVGSPERADRIIDAWVALRSSQNMLNAAAQRMHELDQALPELHQRAQASQQANYELADRQARENAERAAQDRMEAARFAAKEAADAQTAKDRQQALENARPMAEQAATERSGQEEERARRTAALDTYRAQEQSNRDYITDLRARQTAEDISPLQQRGESYPSTLDAAYDQVRGNAPPGNMPNLLGSDTRGPTNVFRELDSIAREARQSLQLKGYKNGQLFDDNGDIVPNLYAFLQNKLGPDIAKRLQRYAELRASNGTTPGMKGLVDIRTDIRRAEEVLNKKSDFPGQPRTEDASMLARLQSALNRDIESFAAERGAVGENWLRQWRFVNGEYEKYVNDIRAPLAKVFGENVDPGAAIQELTGAMQIGSKKTDVLNAFYHAVDSRGDRAQMTSLLLHNLMEGATPAEQVANFLARYKAISPEAKNVMFAGETAGMGMALDRLASQGDLIKSFLRTAGKEWHPNLHVGNMATLGIGLLYFHSIPTIIASIVGAGGLARIVSSRWYGGWLKATPLERGAYSPEWTQHMNRLRALVTATLGLDQDTSKKLGEVLLPPAKAADVPNLRSAAQGAQHEPNGTVTDPIEAPNPDIHDHNAIKPDTYMDQERQRKFSLPNLGRVDAAYRLGGADQKTQNDASAPISSSQEPATQDDANAAARDEQENYRSPDEIKQEINQKLLHEKNPERAEQLRRALKMMNGGYMQLGGSDGRPDRLPGEAAAAPRGTAIAGQGESAPEDWEAGIRAAEHIHAPAEISASPEQRGLVVGVPRGGYTTERGTPARIMEGLENSAPVHALRTLGSDEGQYRPGEQDEEGVRLGNAAASVIPAGSIAKAAVGGIEANSLGTFIGRVHADRLAEAGRPTAQRALQMAQIMEKRGASYDQIREATNNLIERDDPALRGVTQMDNGKWAVELSDHDTDWALPKFEGMRRGQTMRSTVGEALPNEEAAIASPDIATLPVKYMRPSNPKPEDPIGGLIPGIRMEVTARRDIGPRAIALHERNHAFQEAAGFPQGSNVRIDPELPEKIEAALTDPSPSGLRKSDEENIVDAAYRSIPDFYGETIDQLRTHVLQLQMEGELPENLTALSRNLARRAEYLRYQKSSGEVWSGVVEDRRDLTPQEGRQFDPRDAADERVPRAERTMNGKPLGPQEARPRGRMSDESDAALAEQKSAWTPERKAHFADLQAQGKSFGEIADAMGMTQSDLKKVSRLNWNEDSNTALAKMRRAGKSPQEIAAELGTTEDAVNQAASRQDIDSLRIGQDRMRWTDEQHAALSRLRNDGLSNKDIADHLETTEGAVKKAIRLNGEDLGIAERTNWGHDPVWTPERRAQFADLYNGTRRLPEIADIMGLNRRQVATFIANNPWVRGQGGKLPSGPVPNNKVGRGRFAETTVDANAMGLEKQLRGYEDLLLRGKQSPEQIAKAINGKFGERITGGVTPEDIKSGNVWWRIGEEADTASNTVPFEEYMSPAVEPADEGEAVYSRRGPPNNDDEEKHHSYYQPRKKGRFSGPPGNVLTVQ